MLKEFTNIFNLEIQGNQVSDLSPLSSMKYLVQLDASRNKLQDKISCPGIANLQDVNLSKNQISTIEGLSYHRYLINVNLDSI